MMRPIVSSRGLRLYAISSAFGSTRAFLNTRTARSSPLPNDLVEKPYFFASL